MLWLHACANPGALPTSQLTLTEGPAGLCQYAWCLAGNRLSREAKTLMSDEEAAHTWGDLSGQHACVIVNPAGVD